jgi:hypothetical protein
MAFRIRSVSLEAAASQTWQRLALIDKGLAIADEMGERFTDPYLHRLRGEILLERDPSDPAPADQAIKVAITAAKAQGARSYELIASLALAKLYQSTSCSTDAEARDARDR